MRVMTLLIFSALFGAVFASQLLTSAWAEDRTPSQLLQHNLADLKTFQATFTQTVTDTQGQILQRSEGSMTMARPNQLRWQVRSPDDTLLVANGQEVFYADSLLEQVSIYDQAAMIDNNPMMLLSSDDPAIWSQFTITSGLEPDQFYIDSIAPDSQITQVVMAFKQAQLIQLEVVDSTGQRSVFIFSDVRQNVPLAQDTFVYSIPADFFIDDQRAR